MPVLLTPHAELPGESAAWAKAIESYAAAPRDENTKPLDGFLRQFPHSPRRAALLLHLGESARKSGRVTRSLDRWETAWQETKAVQDLNSHILASAALAGLLEIHTHFGHADRVEALLHESRSRELRGAATERALMAAEALRKWRHDPAAEFRCGPESLARVRAHLGLPADNRIAQARGANTGFSLEMLAQLAAGTNTPLVPARLTGGQFPVPSIVHYRQEHFAAVTGRKIENGVEYYLIENPLFEGLSWVSAAALAEEVSGFALIPPSAIGSAWRAATAEETRHIWGRCFSGQLDGTWTMDFADTIGGDCTGEDSSGMPTYRFHAFLASLNVTDEPIGYSPPRGPDVRFRLTYNQREISQPAAPNYSNLGPKWTHNFLAWVETNNGRSGEGNLTLAYPNGGSATGIRVARAENRPGQSYTTYYDIGLASRIQLISYAGGNTQVTRFEGIHADGSKYIFGQRDEARNEVKFFLTEVIDPAGNAVKLTYDTRLRLTRITDAIGQTTTLSYDSPRDPLLISKVTDPFGRHAALAYDSQKRLASVTDVAGLTSEFSYASGDFLSSMTTPYGTTAFRTGVPTVPRPNADVDRFIEATDPLGQAERLEFRFFLTTPINDLGMTLFWDKDTFAQSGRDDQKAQLIHWMQSARVTHGMVHYLKRPLESEIRYFYNRGCGTDVETQDGDFSMGNNCLIDFISRPARIARMVNRQPVNAQNIRYNKWGFITRATDAAGRQTTLLYDNDDHDLVELRGGNNQTVARFTYNSQHQPITVTDEGGQRWTFTYNSTGQLLTERDPKGNTATYTYDSRGFLTRINGPLGATVTYTYDRFGRVESTTNTDGDTTHYEYDELDRPTRVTHPDGTSESLAYQRLDPTEFRDRAGRLTTVAYDELRRPTTIADPLGRVATYEWCACGALRAVTDAMGRRTAWERDLQMRPTSRLFPDGTRTRLTYDPVTGRLKEVQDGKGQLTSYEYNPDGSVRRIAGAADNVTFTYDPDFRRVRTVQDQIGTTTFTYNRAGALGGLQANAIEGPVPNSIARFTYDELGRVAIKIVNGAETRYAYDALGRITQQTNPLGDIVDTYDAATNRLTQRKLPNGITAVLAYHGRDKHRNLRVLDYQANGQSLWRQELDWDATGNLTTPGLVYDAADQLVSAGGQDFTYDAAGQRLPAPELTYDANGNLVSDGRRRFEWDGRNRLTAIVNGSRRTEFVYDAFDRRTRTTEKSEGGVLNSYWHVWCGSSICEERAGDDAASTTRRYFPQGETDSAGLPAIYLTNYLGSTIQRTDATAATLHSYDYDAWGRLTTGGETPPMFGLAGYLLHAPSGLYLAQYRAYDPELGQWLSRDPTGESDGLNLYRFAGNNPTSAIDPDGLDTKRLGVNLGGNFHFIGGGSGSVSTGILWGTSRTGRLFPLQLYASRQVGIGAGEGGGVFAGITAGYAPLADLEDAPGDSLGWGLGGGLLSEYSYNQSASLDSNGKPIPRTAEFGGDASVGLGGGWSFDVSRGQTIVTSIPAQRPKPILLKASAAVDVYLQPPPRRPKRRRPPKRHGIPPFHLKICKYEAERPNIDTSLQLTSEEVHGLILPRAPEPPTP